MDFHFSKLFCQNFEKPSGHTAKQNIQTRAVIWHYSSDRNLCLEMPQIVNYNLTVNKIRRTQVFRIFC